MPRFAAVAVLLIATSAQAGVTNLKAVCRKGKTYVTFAQVAGEGRTYRVYRSTGRIASVDRLTPLATLSDTSGVEPYHKWRHIIEEEGEPLAQGVGLFVYTPKADVEAFYAVTVVADGKEDATVVAGENALTEPVAEKHVEWPGAVLREVKADRRGRVFLFYHWMDYADWHHRGEYYGHFFLVRFPDALKDKTPRPLITNLHSAGGAARPGKPTAELAMFSSAISLATSDTYKFPKELGYVDSTGWTGYRANYGEHRPKEGDRVVMYTERRVIAYTHAVMKDPRFAIDPNRVYLRGSSMGGMGTLFIGPHHPEIWAAMRANVAPIFRGNDEPRDWGDVTKRWAAPGEWSRAAGRFGPFEMGLTTRGGVKVYNWVSISWMARNLLDREFPPLVHSHASKDWKRAMRLNRNLYWAFAETHRGVWGKWVDKGHGRHAYGSDVVPGGFMRFLKNEMYPAFANATADDDYGRKDPDKRAFIGATGDKDPLKFDAAGVMNGYIDWTSKLHDMGLARDDLVDTAERIALTMKSSRPDTKADVTLHRVQQFRVEAGKTYAWRNVDVASGKTVGSGEVTADTRGLLTVKGVAIAKTGSRLIVTEP